MNLLFYLSYVKKYLVVATLGLCIFCFFLTVPALALPMRTICLVSGPLTEYNNVLYGIALTLHANGCLDQPLPSNTKTDNVEHLWQWMSEHTNSDIRFLPDGFYSAMWEDDKFPSIRDEVVKRIETRKDVDAILVFGTRMAKVMSELETDIPIIVTSVTNPIDSGIITSYDDPGKDNLIVLVSPKRFKKQVELFHQFFKFKKLGIVYEDNPIGRSEVSLNEIQAAANNLNITLSSCKTILHDNDINIITDNILECHKNLIRQQVDAIYLTSSVELPPKHIRYTLTPIIAANIPTFSQSGVSDVKSGALLSLVNPDIVEGKYAGQVLMKLITGMLPKKIDNKFYQPILLAINLRTAASIGWNPPLDVLLLVDEFYE